MVLTSEKTNQTEIFYLMSGVTKTGERSSVDHAGVEVVSNIPSKPYNQRTQSSGKG
jgi:hypothetical protein